MLKMIRERKGRQPKKQDNLPQSEPNTEIRTQLQNLIEIVNKGSFFQMEGLSDHAIEVLTNFIKKTSDAAELKLLTEVFTILEEYSEGYIQRPREKKQRLKNKEIKSKISHHLNAFTNIIVFYRNESRWQKLRIILSQIEFEQSGATHRLF